MCSEKNIRSELPLAQTPNFKQMHDGIKKLISQSQTSVLLLSPAAHQLAANLEEFYLSMRSGQVGMGGGADPGSDHSQEAIGLRETRRARRMTYWIHHYHTSIAFPPICEKTKLASAHRLVIQTDCQQHCTSSEV